MALALGLMTSSCDEINGPYKEITPGPAPIDTTGNDTTGTDTTQIIRKVLLEEFTGHKCGNCPAGAETAEQLKGFYGDKLIVLSIHAGYFATVTPHQLGYYQYEFRTPAGNEIAGEYNIDALGTPNGLVNRTSHQVLGITAWGAKIDSLASLPAEAKIKINPTVNAATRLLQVEVKTTFTQNTTAPKNLTLFLTESGKISQQKDYRQVGNEDILNYSHDHFLRTSLTPTWGEPLTTQPVAAGTEITKQYTYVIPAEYNMAKCRLVAIVNNPVMQGTNNSYEIIQAEESEYLQ